VFQPQHGRVIGTSSSEKSGTYNARKKFQTKANQKDDWCWALQAGCGGRCSLFVATAASYLIYRFAARETKPMLYRLVLSRLVSPRLASARTQR